MTENILPLIEESIKNNNDETISKLSSKLDMDISQTKLFLKYFNKFNILSSLLDSNYLNYFNKICLTDLREKDELTDKNFAQAIIIFIKEKRKGKNIYYVSLHSENDVNLQILILSQLEYKSYKYELSLSNLDLKNHLEIFNYVTYVDDHYIFEGLINELIDNLIDSPSINYVSLNNMQFDKILKYSRKYPNRIKHIDFYDFKEYDKLKELLELNKESLISYPHNVMKYLIPLKNAFIFNFNELNEEINDNYDLTKITRININNIEYYLEDSNEVTNGSNSLINLLNKCPNAEYLCFCDIGSENFLHILENVNCPKVKRIYATCEDLNRDYDWSLVFEKMPLLEELDIEEHQTMCWTYQISPVFLAENKRLAFPLLEQLIRNYLNGSPDRDITLQFDDEFDEFWDYFKNKKDIISRVSKLYGNCVNESLDSYFKVTIGQYETVDQIKDAKYYYCFVETPFEEKTLEFIKRNKIEYLFILNGGSVNFEELKKCKDLKFVFDKLEKNFYYLNKENNILDKI